MRGKMLPSAARVASVVATPALTASFWTTAVLSVQRKKGVDGVVKERLTNASFISTVAESHDLSIAESKRIVNTIINTIADVSIL
jgi:hypothetical protein